MYFTYLLHQTPEEHASVYGPPTTAKRLYLLWWIADFGDLKVIASIT
jgi:hypothetical protein